MTLTENAHALRPFREGSDATVVEAGTLENDETNYVVPRAVFNIGIVERFEIDITTGFELVDDDAADRTLGSVSDTGLSFMTLWSKGEERAPSIATELSLSLPTARREFQPDERRKVGGGRPRRYQRLFHRRRNW